MDLFTLSAKLQLDKSEYEQGLRDSETSAESSGSKIASAFGVAGKATAAGIAASTTAIVGLVKSSTEAYADYEQLVGGVETLFGAGGKSIEEYAQSVGKTVEEAQSDYDKLMMAQGKVMENASVAFYTAGMDANSYMETVTSSAAALTQSLGGDTVAAAMKADQAIIDMADNANKMGSSIEAIQTAYAGFSKQNFTMLDNLKLGYGGTKSEMERLLEDAEKIKASQGEVADYSIDSYADIVDAIHVVQDEMGITGTTAKEAEKTISGSIAMTKSAWQNLITGLADGDANIQTLISDLMYSVKAVGSNLIPVVEQALQGIGELLHELVPIIGEEMPVVLEELLPTVLDTATQLFTYIVEALPSLLEIIVEQLPSIFETLLTAIIDLAPTLLETAISLVDTLATGLVDAIPRLIPAITQMIADLALMLTEPNNLTKLIMGAVQIMVAIATGLVQAIPQLIAVVPQIILNLVEAIIQLVPQLLQAGVQLLVGLVTGWLSIKDSLFEAGAELINGLIDKVVEIGAGLLDKGIELVQNIIDGIAGKFTDLVTKGEEIVTNVKDGFMNMVTGAVDWGKDLIDNFISGLKEKWEALKSTVSDIAGSIADYLGFSEPEKGPLSNFHTYAPDMMDLFMQGIKDNKSRLLGTVSDAFDFQDLIVAPSMEMGGNMEYNSNSGVYSMLQTIATYLPQIANMQVVLDTGALVGQTAPLMNEELGLIYDNEQRSV